MSDDYYSYKPLVRLDRPLALAGLPGADTRMVARCVAMFTGLETVFVDRVVTHVLGYSPERLEITGQRAERLRHERELLEKALARRTPPVVALSDVTLLDPTLADWVMERARTVYLRLSVDELIARLRDEVAQDETKHFALLRGEPPDPAVLGPQLTRWAAHLERCEIVHDVSQRAPQRVANDLMRQLGMS